MNIFTLLTKKNQLIGGSLFTLVLVILGVSVFFLGTRAVDPLAYVNMQGAKGLIELHLDRAENQLQGKKIFESAFYRNTIEMQISPYKDLVEVVKNLTHRLQMVVFEKDILFIVHESDKGQLLNLSPQKFSIKRQGNLLFFTIKDGEKLLDRVHKEKITEESNKNIFSRNLFEANSLISFEVPEGDSMDKIFSLWKIQDVYEDALIKKIAKPLIRSLQGNILFDEHSNIILSMRGSGAKDLLALLSNRERINRDLMDKISKNTHQGLFVAFPENGYEHMQQFITQVGGDRVQSLWNKVEDGIVARYPFVEDIQNLTNSVEGRSILIEKTSSGNTLLSVWAKNDEKGTEELYRRFFEGIKNKVAYEEKVEKLPDGSKSTMLESHPEKVKESQVTLTGALVKEIAFDGIPKLTYRSENEWHRFSTGQATIDSERSLLGSMIQKQFTEPYHIIAYQKITGEKAYILAVAFQPDGIFFKVLLPRE